MKRKLSRKFNKILRMTQNQLIDYLPEVLKGLQYKPVVEKGFIYAKGELPVLLVAHMDTVHITPPIDIINKNGIISSPQGIGGDDRCGIYIILEIIKELRCSVLFTEDEEIGAKGAKKFCNSPIMKNVSVNYIIEFDRRGNNDAVFYDCDNEEFEEFITSNSFFRFAWGSFSDITFIAPCLKVAAVNLSSGYYNAHTLREYIDLKEVVAIIKEAKKIISTPSEKFEYIETMSYYDDWYSNYYSGYKKNKIKINGYDYEYSEDSYTWEKASESPYIFYWNDKDLETRESLVYAKSELEAVATFLMENCDVTYGEVVDYYEVGIEELSYYYKI